MEGEKKERPAATRAKKKPRSRWRKNVSRGVQYAFFRVVAAVIGRLPLSVGRAIAAFGGWVGYSCVRRSRDIAIDNLTHVYGAEKTPAEIRSMARQVFQHTVWVFVEWLILRRWTPERLEARFPELAEGVKHLAGLREESGIVVITAHFGNWEMLSLSVNHFSKLAYSVAKRPKFPPTARFLHKLRCDSGATVIYTDESPRKLLRALRDGNVLGLLPDQDIRTNSGIFVEFFDRPAHTVTFPMALARKTRVPVCTCYLVRDGKGYRFLISEPFHVAQTEDEENDLLEATQHWSRRLEEGVRQYPTQWFWHYPRWRSTPEDRRQHQYRATEEA